MRIKDVRKLPFPDFLFNEKCKIVLEDDNNLIDENGSPIKHEEVIKQCIFSEKSKRIITEDGREVVLLGTVIIKGDIAPMMKTISSGLITINEREYQIYECSRPRNPEGSVHHTMLLIK